MMKGQEQTIPKRCLERGHTDERLKAGGKSEGGAGHQKREETSSLAEVVNDQQRRGKRIHGEGMRLEEGIVYPAYAVASAVVTAAEHAFLIPSKIHCSEWNRRHTELGALYAEADRLKELLREEYLIAIRFSIWRNTRPRVAECDEVAQLHLDEIMMLENDMELAPQVLENRDHQQEFQLCRNRPPGNV